jgi:hypothetical protein
LPLFCLLNFSRTYSTPLQLKLQAQPKFLLFINNNCISKPAAGTSPKIPRRLFFFVEMCYNEMWRSYTAANKKDNGNEGL